MYTNAAGCSPFVPITSKSTITNLTDFSYYLFVLICYASLLNCRTVYYAPYIPICSVHAPFYIPYNYYIATPAHTDIALHTRTPHTALFTERTYYTLAHRTLRGAYRLAHILHTRTPHSSQSVSFSAYLTHSHTALFTERTYYTLAHRTLHREYRLAHILHTRTPHSSQSVHITHSHTALFTESIV